MTALTAGLTTSPEALLRLALKLDAIVTGVNDAAYLAAAGLLDSALGVEAGLLRGIGAFLLVFAAVVWIAATRKIVPPAAVRAVVTANAIWAADSLVVLAAGWLSPTTFGGVWIALQALVVAGFAGLQAYALRRS
jgi:hypothetical protein